MNQNLLKINTYCVINIEEKPEGDKFCVPGCHSRDDDMETNKGVIP